MYLPFKFKLRKFWLTIRQSSKIVIKLVIIDQVVKWWFIGYLRNRPGLTLEITSFLDMVYSWNYGISFGLLRNYYQYSNMLFSVLNSAIIVYLWGVLLQCKSILGFIGYSFVIGGALGNLIDRFINGAVFDFIYFHYQDIGFPVFNLADSFISAGVIVLLYDYYRFKKIVAQKNIILYNNALVHHEAERIRSLALKKKYQR